MPTATPSTAARLHNLAGYCAVSNTTTWDFNARQYQRTFSPYIHYVFPERRARTRLAERRAAICLRGNLGSSQNSFQIYGGQVAIEGQHHRHQRLDHGQPARATSTSIWRPSLTAPAVVSTNTTTTALQYVSCFFNPGGPGCTTTTTTTSVNGGAISVFQYNYDPGRRDEPDRQFGPALIQSDQFGKSAGDL